MTQKTSKGPCYQCGALHTKGTFLRHFDSAHPVQGAALQVCTRLKIESADDLTYWLIVDAGETATLKTLDGFLRRIWLECCGHMSGFFCQRESVGKGQKIAVLPEGLKLRYEYDFGSTTELKITVLGHGLRPKQREAVRVLARNVAPEHVCRICGEPAAAYCVECEWEHQSPFLCPDCGMRHRQQHGGMLPVVNSPRMGVCAYCGEQDKYEFQPPCGDVPRAKGATAHDPV